jgi:hypothetical protein
MLEVEITQQRSIHTTKWEIVLGMLILILNQLNFFFIVPLTYVFVSSNKIT